jgi:hypothetical protein
MFAMKLGMKVDALTALKLSRYLLSSHMSHSSNFSLTSNNEIPELLFVVQFETDLVSQMDPKKLKERV